jgi:uncharacterized protein
MDNRRILFCIYTPAQAHTWHYIIQGLMDKGHDVKILAREYGSAVKILSSYGFEVNSFKSNTRNSARVFETLDYFHKGREISRAFRPTIIVGFGVTVALAAALNRKLGIVFTDSENIPVQNVLTKMFASVIIAPSCFRIDLGKKFFCIDGYKELAYLHPNYFKPDPEIYDELKINRGEKYAILRLNAFDAFHDIGKKGFSTTDQITLVKELGKHVRVFISPEGKLTEELEEYRLPIPFERIHHAIYYAQLLVTDTQTMTTEAAVLGTPAIRCNSFCGTNDMGNFLELENKFDLIYSFREPDRAIDKAKELICQPDLKERWSVKRQKLLSEKIDVTNFMVDFIENYPNSFNKYKERISKS